MAGLAVRNLSYRLRDRRILSDICLTPGHPRCSARGTERLGLDHPKLFLIPFRKRPDRIWDV